MFFFYPKSYVQYIIKWVFPHDLLNAEIVITGFSEVKLATRWCQRNTVFINIIHAAGQPAFVIRSKAEIVANGLGTVLSRLFGDKVDVNVVEVVFIVMTENKKKLVRR